MKKRALVNKVEDHILSAEYPATGRVHPPAAKNISADSASVERQRDVSRISGERPRIQSAIIPRLFIRGGVGGSLKMDIPGIDSKYSGAAFAQWISDESLEKIRVHRGDVALVDPVQPLRDGAMVFIGINGFEVFRRLKKQGRIWLLESLDGVSSPPILLLNHPIYGVIFGFVRFVTKAKAVAITSELQIADGV